MKLASDDRIFDETGFGTKFVPMGQQLFVGESCEVAPMGRIHRMKVGFVRCSSADPNFGNHLFERSILEMTVSEGFSSGPWMVENVVVSGVQFRFRMVTERNFPHLLW